MDRSTALAVAFTTASSILGVASGCSSDSSGDSSSGGGPDSGTREAGPPGIFTGRCGDPVPRGAVPAPPPPAYSGGSCPTLTTGAAAPNTFTSSGVTRQFMVITPEDMRPDESLPVVFLWHWLGGSAQQFHDIIAAQATANTERIIAVIPEAIGGSAESPGSTPISRWRAWAAANPDTMRDEEFVFFDDMLACVSEQLPVDASCVASAGVSDGALFTSQLMAGRGRYLASAVVLSGGVSDGVDVNGALIKQPVAQERPLPVLALWGGATDICIILQFETATLELERRLQENGNFVVECHHNCGHSVPPVDISAGGSLFDPFIHFIRSHPYWTTVGHSPYEAVGLPASMPPWCAIGVGNAVARTGDCPAGLGCPILTP